MHCQTALPAACAAPCTCVRPRPLRVTIPLPRGGDRTGRGQGTPRVTPRGEDSSVWLQSSRCRCLAPRRRGVRAECGVCSAAALGARRGERVPEASGVQVPRQFRAPERRVPARLSASLPGRHHQDRPRVRVVTLAGRRALRVLSPPSPPSAPPVPADCAPRARWRAHAGTPHAAAPPAGPAAVALASFFPWG